MNEENVRMTQSEAPRESEIEQWIGKDAFKYWTLVTARIRDIYPGVFTPEWLFGGKKHGWSLRYKKNRSFCTLIPEKNRFALLLVFGAEERAKVETIRESLSQYTRGEYDKAATYHDGKWVLFSINNDRVIEDVVRLMALKRRPRVS